MMKQPNSKVITYNVSTVGYQSSVDCMLLIVSDHIEIVFTKKMANIQNSSQEVSPEHSLIKKTSI